VTRRPGVVVFCIAMIWSAWSAPLHAAPTLVPLDAAWAGWAADPEIRPRGKDLVVRFDARSDERLRLRFVGPRGEQGRAVDAAGGVGAHEVVVPRPKLRAGRDGRAIHDGDLRLEVVARDRRGSPAAIAVIERWLRAPRVRLMGGTTLVAGSRHAPRVVVTERAGCASGGCRDRAVAGAEVVFALVAGKRELATWRGVSDAGGTVAPELLVPDQPGQAELVARVTVDGAEVTTRVAVEIIRQTRVFVTTDKPLYQPSQAMHLRLLARDAGTGRAAGDRPVRVAVHDGRNNKIFQVSGRTSAEGVFATRLDIAARVNMGTWRVEALVGDAKAERTVEVKTYALPKFKVVVSPERPFWKPGEEVRGTVRADYFFGKPVAGGKVVLRAESMDVQRFEVARVSVALSADGHGSFAFRLPETMAGTPSAGGAAQVALEAEVTDAAAQVEVGRAEVRVSAEPLAVTALPEAGQLVPGFENVVHLVVTRPDGAPVAGARVEVSATGAAVRDAAVTTDMRGLAVVRMVPDGTGVAMNLAVQAPDGAFVRRQVTPGVARGEAQMLVRADDLMPRVGARVGIDVHVQRTMPHVFVDLVRDGQTLLTLSAPAREGRAHVDWEVPAGIEGTLLLHAWAITDRGEFASDTRPLVVRPADELRVAVKADRETWRPGETARLQFKVTDAASRPVQAVMGVQIVDEAVFALAEQMPGLAKVFFLLEEELLKPKVEFHAFEPAELVVADGPVATAAAVISAATMTRHRQQVASDSRAGAVTDSAGLWRGLFDARADTLRRALRAWVKKAWRSPTPREVKQLSAAAGVIDGRTVDWFGVPFKLDVKADGREVFSIGLASAGVDARWETDDDLFADLGLDEAMQPVWDHQARKEMVVMRMGDGGMRGAMFSFGMAGSGVGGGGAGSGRVVIAGTGVQGTGRGAGGGGGGETPRVRTWFPETLLVAPTLLTDATGLATLDVPLADSITTWRMSVLASDRAGRLGSAQETLRVFQDFFVDIAFPAGLTRGDEVSVPVAVYNYLKTPQTISFEMQASGGLELQGPTTLTLELGPDEVRGISVPLRAAAVGTGRLKVVARGSALSDAIEREVRVTPDGFPVDQVASGYLRGATKVDVDVPAGVVPGSEQLMVKLYPGSFAVVVDGLENMLRVPSGCFEQTSSSTYPNILVLKYLRDSKRTKPELEAKALAYLQAGWQRLVTYEVKGGGFSWFGDAPANQVLTAYGLMEFADMDEVMPIDRAVIARTRQWLVKQQQADGSWKPDASFLHQESWGDIQKSSVLVTAWVAWALARTRSVRAEVDAPLRKALGYLQQHVGSARDPYALAYVANAFAEALDGRKDAGLEAALERVVGRLAATAEREGDALAFPTAMRTATYGSGQGAQVEVTALALRALMRAGDHLELVKPGLGWLAAKKDPLGNWHTTQATIQVLQALVASLGAQPEAVAGSVRVRVNGADVATVAYAPDDFDVVRFVDASAALKPGANTVEIIPSDGLESMFQLQSSVHLPWSRRDPVQAAADAFAVDVAWDRTALAKDDTAQVEVTVTSRLAGVASMGMVDVGVPPGFEVLAEDLEAAVAKGVIQRFELTGRQVVLYVAEFRPDAPFRVSWRVRARFPVRAASGSASAWEYYDVKNKGVAAPVAMTVR
jgi:hypothetical protein